LGVATVTPGARLPQGGAETRFTGGMKLGLFNASIPLAHLTLRADSLRVGLRAPMSFFFGWWVRGSSIPYESIRALGVVRSDFGTRGVEIIRGERKLLVFWYRARDERTLLLELRHRGLSVATLNRSIGILTRRSANVPPLP
jgi:hypothetical protein